eukprot:18763-Eustigmatos_ZCMA.PRE.1
MLPADTILLSTRARGTAQTLDAAVVRREPVDVVTNDRVMIIIIVAKVVVCCGECIHAAVIARCTIIIVASVCV